MRLDLTLVNKTAWSSRDLRRFLLAGMRARGVEERTVIITYGKWDAHHGLGWYRYPQLQLSLPGPAAIARALAKGEEPIRYLELAQVLEHEIDHTLGLGHREMIDWWKLRPTWHEGITIEWEGEPVAISDIVRAAELPAPPTAVASSRSPRRRRLVRRYFTPPGARPRFTPPGGPL